MMPELDVAIEHHRAGRLEQAEQLYLALLERDSQSSDARHLLGVVAHQRGDAASAIDLIQGAIAEKPLQAAYHNNLGEAYRAAGDVPRAVECFRRALQLEPAYAEAHNNVGLCLLEPRQLAEAERHFRQALETQPDCALAWNNLGHALREQGRLAEAAAAYRQAVHLAPQLPHAHNNLGQLLLESGEIDAACEHCREAVRLAPGFAAARNNLGNVLREQGRLEEAQLEYARAIQLDPGLAMAYNNLGQALQEAGRFDEALAHYRQALEREPASPRFHCNLGSVLTELGRFDEAIVQFQRALQIDLDYAEADNAWGYALEERGCLEQAAACYRNAVRKRLTFAAAWANLGHAYAQLGELERAYNCCRDALRHDPDAIGAYVNIATHHLRQFTTEDEVAVRRLLEKPYMNDGQRAALHHALANVLDDRDQFAEAARHMQQANAFKRASRARRGETYNRHAHSAFVDELIDTFDADYFQRTAGFGLETPLPVFVFGLPRSGTTLTEQILASHPQVHGAGELSLAQDAFDALTASAATESALQSIGAVAAEDVHAAARRHWEHLVQHNRRADRIVDKMPDNYLYLGWIVSLFPKARLIHCRRDLRDVALSCWKTNFKSIRWACDAGDIASRIRDYERLMQHWRRVLPIRFLEIEYEETVANLEDVARTLLEYLRLPWDPACLEFHRTKRPVRTASMTQVRQPVYSRSAGRWKHYGSELAQLCDPLRVG